MVLTRNYQEILRLWHKKNIKTFERKKKTQNNKDSILFNQTCLYIYLEQEMNRFKLIAS